MSIGISIALYAAEGVGCGSHPMDAASCLGKLVSAGTMPRISVHFARQFLKQFRH